MPDEDNGSEGGNMKSGKYIEARTGVKVRFSDVDAMGVVWHGHYLKFFEDGREALGEMFGLDYMDVYKNGYFIPIVRTNINYKSPIHFGDEVEVVTRMHYSRAAKIVHTYEVWNKTHNKLSCEGYTEQVFLFRDSRELELFTPGFYSDWLQKLDWQNE